MNFKSRLHTIAGQPLEYTYTADKTLPFSVRLYFDKDAPQLYRNHIAKAILLHLQEKGKAVRFYPEDGMFIYEAHAKNTLNLAAFEKALEVTSRELPDVESVRQRIVQGKSGGISME